MSKAASQQTTVQGTVVTIAAGPVEDYISLTDIARHRDAERTDYIISNWLRNRNTIEFLGIWERLNNPSFNYVEFDGIRGYAGLNNQAAIQQLRILLANPGAEQIEGGKP